MNRFLLATLLSMVSGLRPVAAALTQIGAAAAVKGAPTAKSEGEPAGHIISSGKPIFKNDHVTTDGASRLQVLLKDQTVFTLGPDSDMVLDQFDFDPNTQAGKVTASIKKGVFRFVTGKIASAQPSAMKVKLPVGTIGIRGTIVAGIVRPNMCAAMLGGPGAGNNANAKVGAFELSNTKGDSTLVKESGKGSMIVGNAAPTPAGVLPASVMGEINAGLAVKPTSGSSGESEGSQGASNSGTAPAEDSGEASVAEQSGDQTASAQGTASEQEGATALSEELATTSTQGSQDNVKVTAGVADGVATWNQIASGVTSGDAFYFSNHVPVNCPNCFMSSSTEGALQLYINFASRVVGGNAPRTGPSGQSQSFVHLHGVYSSGDTVQSDIGNPSNRTLPIDYSSLSGSAILSGSCFGPASGGQTGDTFSGTTVEIRNKGGQVAAEAVANIQFVNSSTSKSATGTITAPRSSTAP